MPRTYRFTMPITTIFVLLCVVSCADNKTLPPGTSMDGGGSPATDLRSEQPDLRQSEPADLKPQDFLTLTLDGTLMCPPPLGWSGHLSAAVENGDTILVGGDCGNERRALLKFGPLPPMGTMAPCSLVYVRDQGRAADCGTGMGLTRAEGNLTLSGAAGSFRIDGTCTCRPSMTATFSLPLRL